MKIQLKKRLRLSKKKTIFLGVLVLFMLPLAYFVKSSMAAADINLSLSLGSLPNIFKFQKNGQAPCPGTKYNFCLSGNIYMEIAQPGTGSSLDAPESWSKSYIDPTRINSAVIGIYDGQYSRQVFGAADEYDANGTKRTFSDSGSAVFEFYTAKDIQRVNGDFDEIPCSVDRVYKPFLVMNSKDLSKKSWQTIDISEALKNRDPGCTAPNANNGLVTKKTNKIVIFVKARWTNSSGEGRVNAFKMGSAYTDADNALGNSGQTGYYSQYTSATNPGETVNNGQYAVQNRTDDADTQGHYYFDFAPDCHLAPGAEETRFIKWKDVDYPDYYVGLTKPGFRLLDVTGGGQTLVKDVDGNDLDISGSDLGGNGQYRERKVIFKGGHVYEWHWFNITARDGIVFWLPFDDFPSLAGGCGSYNQSIGLWGGRAGDAQSQNNFIARGGDTLNFLVDEANTGGSAAAPDTTTVATLTPQSNSPYAKTFSDPGGATNISQDGQRYGPLNVVWTLPGLGPNLPYTTRRWLQFSYQVKNDAQNGAKHCFDASMTPGSSAAPGALRSNTVCVTIDNSLRPYLSTSGADVHAGDCSVTAPNNGKITGPPVSALKLGSSGSYIVSAGDAISGFGSGGDPAGEDLTFGKGGYYGKICRPLISELLSNADKDKVTTITPGGASFDLSSIPAGQRTIVRFPGSGTITGVSSAPVTVIADRGTLTVAGSGTVGANNIVKTSRDKLPVVGMIAKDIEVAPDVKELNAALYAEKNINTCNVANWATSGFNACRNTLIIRGFAMAKDFSFRRISAGNSGLQNGEQIDYNAAFYLNPPPGMGVPGNAVKYLGEQAPRY